MVLKSRSKDFNRLYDESKIENIDLLIIGVLILSRVLLNTTVTMYILLIYIIINILKKSFNYTFYVCLTLIPNMGVIFAPGLPIPLINIIIIIALVMLFFKKQSLKIDKRLMLIAFIFILYEWVHCINYNILSLMSLITWTSSIIYITIFIDNKEEHYNHKLAIKYFVAGVLVSTVYGIYLRVNTVGFNFVSSNVNDRFIGAAGDPNYYSMYILLAILSIVTLVNNNIKLEDKIKYSVTIIIFTFMGFMTLSRMYIIALLILSVMYLFINIIDLRNYINQRKFIFLSIIILVPIIFMGKEVIFKNLDIIFSRFSENINNMSMLFSNRDIIVKKYISFWNDNPIHLIFGVGIQKYNIRIGTSYAHNILIELIATLGIVGILILFLYIASIHIKIRNNSIDYRYNLINLLPIICISICFLSINAIEVEGFYILLVYVIQNIYYKSKFGKLYK